MTTKHHTLQLQRSILLQFQYQYNRMSDNPVRKKSCATVCTRKYEHNKENLHQDRAIFETSKDFLQRMASEELNELSDIDFKKIDFISKAPKGLVEDITGWNHPPSRILNFRSSSEQLKIKEKPGSASKVKKKGSRVPLFEGRNGRFHLKTATVETSGDEVLVCKPITTEPTQQVDNHEHKYDNIVLNKEPKPREDSSKLYNIIKSIQRQNSKLLRKLFQIKSPFRQLQHNNGYDSKRAALRSASRPISSLRRQKSKENIPKGEDLKSNTATVLDFILCNQKGVIPSSAIRTAKPDLRSIRKFAMECSDTDNYIFYSEKNPVARFMTRSKIPANSLPRHR